jgi:glycosyltransferase involved in cell wall biosynthesis
MPSPRLSLCTYTFNDAEFVHDLLAQMPSWQVKPDEIVVVDDGSKQPFAPLAPLPNLRVVRLDPNQGITRAKGTGLSAATGEVIFSMDCDTRVAPDWLAVNLPNLLRPGVGLVGGALAHAAGEDLVSRYLRAYGDNHNLHHVGEVEFIPGNAFLLRRSTWEQVGGFSAYTETNCQDHYLCNLLRSQGYSLYSDAAAKAWQLRRIRRTTLMKRVWKWCHKAVKGQMLGGDRAVPYLFEVAVKPMLDRFATSIEMGEPLFLYVDLLYMTHTVLDCLDFGVAEGLATDAVRAGFLRRLAGLFAGYPRLWACFRADLADTGHQVLMPAAGDEDAWEDFFLFSDMLRHSGLFDWLEREGVDQLKLEDRQEHYHFSSYAQASFDMKPPQN